MRANLFRPQKGFREYVRWRNSPGGRKRGGGDDQKKGMKRKYWTRQRRKIHYLMNQTWGYFCWQILFSQPFWPLNPLMWWVSKQNGRSINNKAEQWLFHNKRPLGESITEALLLWSGCTNVTCKCWVRIPFGAYVWNYVWTLLISSASLLTSGIRDDSPSRRPVRRGGAGSTGLAWASWRATSDGDAASWSGAYPADWPPGKEQEFYYC